MRNGNMTSEKSIASSFWTRSVQTSPKLYWSHSLNLLLNQEVTSHVKTCFASPVEKRYNAQALKRLRVPDPCPRFFSPTFS